MFYDTIGNKLLKGQDEGENSKDMSLTFASNLPSEFQTLVCKLRFYRKTETDEDEGTFLCPSPLLGERQNKALCGYEVFYVD